MVGTRAVPYPCSACRTVCPRIDRTHGPRVIRRFRTRSTPEAGDGPGAPSEPGDLPTLAPRLRPYSEAFCELAGADEVAVLFPVTPHGRDVEPVFVVVSSVAAAPAGPSIWREGDEVAAAGLVRGAGDGQLSVEATDGGATGAGSVAAC